MAGAQAAPGRFDRRTAGWLVLWGVTVWAAVYVTIRVVGHVLLDPASPGLVAGFFVATVPLMAAVTYPVYGRLGVARAARPRAAVAMSVPGLFLDAGLLLNAGTVLPRLSADMAVNFGAILLFGYAVVLLTGVLPRPRAST